MIFRVQDLIRRYIPENASWHASKPVYWMIAYLWNTDDDEDGYLRYRPGQFEVIEADNEISDREIGEDKTILEVLPTVVYLSVAVLFSGLVPSTAGYILTLTCLALAWLSVDQWGETTMEVTLKGGVRGGD